MSILLFDEYSEKTIIEIAKLMAIAAQTAPKARGVDNIETIIITESTIKQLSKSMKNIGQKEKMDFFVRDSENILKASAIVIIGARIKSQEIKKCSMCGFTNCNEKNKFIYTPCIFNSLDLGIALGSAVSAASNYKIDNRIMFSVGYAAVNMSLFKTNVKIACGIPLTATTKNPFFDRPQIKQ